jgi:hypothetical protein
VNENRSETKYDEERKRGETNTEALVQTEIKMRLLAALALTVLVLSRKEAEGEEGGGGVAERGLQGEEEGAACGVPIRTLS